jgi:SAM-dependent methyltransferase
MSTHSGKEIEGEELQKESQFGVLAPHYDELMSMVPYDIWVEYISTLFVWASHSPNRVLDCACGTGNVSFEMARRGWQITGVDLSQEMIEVAQLKANSQLEAPRFLQADLSDFDLGETFDSVTCLYDSLNYILEPDKLHAAFERIAAHTQSGGVFVFDMNSDWAFKADLFTQHNFDPRKPLHYQWHADYDPATRVCEVNMKFMRNNADGSQDTFYETHREHAYERAEVEAMLAATGWQLLRAFDAYTLNQPHARSERWFFVARRT